MKLRTDIGGAALLALLLAVAPAVSAAQGDGAKLAAGKHRADSWCGTNPFREQDAALTHGLNTERLNAQGRKQGAAAKVTDVNNLSVVEDDGTIVVPVNPFDVQKKTTVLFTPAGTTGFTVTKGGAKFVKGGATLTGFVGGGPGTPTDDGYKEVPFTTSFRFPFYGETYDRVFVGTNGFVTFGEGDFDSPVLVSASKLASKQPRIAAFWTDLDTTNAAVQVSQTKKMVAITWKGVQIFGENGGSVGDNTFQLQLFKDGRVAMLYKGLTDEADLIGVSPGGNRAQLRRIDVTNPASGAVAGAPFENFSNAEEVDVAGLTQAFYRTHGDDYDFLYIWSDFPTSLGNAFAYYLHIANDVQGIGRPINNDSASYGSAGKLQGLLNLNRPQLYPDDPNQIVPGLGLNSALSIFGQEQGHRWAAYVRFMDNGSPSTALLGRDDDHWSYYFNTESTISSDTGRHSSSMEGNVIRDNNNGTFTTVTDSVNFYSEIDQYLMGLRGPNEVRDMTLVPDGGPRRTDGADNGVTFHGNARRVTIGDVIAAEGPRVPGVAASQKQWRAAWILLVRPGTSPSAATLAKLDTFRTQWEAYFNQALEGRGTLTTTILPKQ